MNDALSNTRMFDTLGAENTCSNTKAFIELLFIDGAPVLYMIDNTTHFSTAQFVEPLKIKSVRKAILKL